jgi:hypothetical protein
MWRYKHFFIRDQRHIRASDWLRAGFPCEASIRPSSWKAAVPRTRRSLSRCCLRAAIDPSKPCNRIA